MKIGNYLEKLSLGLLTLFLATFPFVVTTLTTEIYVLPKQLFLVATGLILLVIFGLKIVSEKEVRIRRTPFDVTVLIFLLVTFLSSLFSVNRAESLISYVPLLFAGLLYFFIVNTAKDRLSVFILIGAFLFSSVILALSSILHFFKVYPFSAIGGLADFAKSQTFTTLGSLLDQGIYLGVALTLAVYLLWPLLYGLFKRKTKEELPLYLNIFNILVSVLVLVGLGVTIYSLVAVQRPIILPYQVGFQTAFAAISQDSARLLQSFFLGSGFGTYAVDFARFKQVSFNATPYWNLTFLRSSSFVLELLATTGVLGLLSYLYIAFKALREKPLFVPLLLYFLITLLLPFSFTSQALLFILLGIYASWLSLSSSKFFDIELALVTLKKGLVSTFKADSKVVPHGGLSRILPFLLFLILLVLVSVVGILVGRYAVANTIFQKSLIATQNNKGSEAYQEQSRAINYVNYSDAYHRVFSQTNLALANSLSQETQKEASPSAQTQQTIYTLIQQAINSARSATDLSPFASVNWQNLSSIYRSLIGFGRNADQFAIQASQQGIRLDPNNPQQYINLGGLYYQLRDFDRAIEQFRLSISLKPDFANAYYNLGYALKEKGDIEAALQQLNIVKELVKNDKTNLDKVISEIKALESGLKKEEAGIAPVETLPPQEPEVPIPAPASPSAQ